MSNTEFKFSLDEKDYLVEKLKGRAARKNMMKILSVVSRLVGAAQANGFDLNSIFTKQRNEDEEQVSIMFDDLLNVLVSIGPVLSDDKLLDDFENLIPVVLGLPKELLDEEGDLLEVYSATIGAMLFHVGLNMTDDASDSLKNSTRQSGLTEPEIQRPKSKSVKKD
jgi:hypothetical protein